MPDQTGRPNPYVGPRALRRGERIYGREREAVQLLELLIAERIVLLYSPSGAGKTSLIQAALVPALEREEFDVLPVIRVGRGASAGIEPANAYVFSALLSLEKNVPPDKTIPQEQLARMRFADYLAQREAASGVEDATFLIFDQFEEVLTLDPLNIATKIEFFTQVGTALRDLKRWALLSMREDHVAALDPFLRPIPTRLKTTFRLDLLKADSARAAIQQPARDAGVEFTEEAATALVDDLRQVAMQDATGRPRQCLGLYIEPVQLQVVCARLWEKLPPGAQEITAAQIESTGDVDSALAQYYAERVAAIAGESKIEERVLRTWFDRQLITDSGLRSQVMAGETDEDVSPDAIRALENVHLVRAEERRGVTWLELAHDRLVKPIRADNAAWFQKNLSVLQHQAAVWESQGRPAALYLRAEALAQAQTWADAHPQQLTPPEREFLDLSSQQQQAGAARRLRKIAAVLLVGMSCITILAVYAFWQRGRAVAQSHLATEQARIASARRVAAHARSLLDERLDLGLLLAAEAVQMADLADTRGSLLTAALSNPRLTTFLHGPPSPVGTVAFSPNGQLLASGNYKGDLVLWNVENRAPAEVRIGLATDALRRLAFSADGRYLAAASKDGAIKLLDLRDSKNDRVLRPPAPRDKAVNVWALAFNRDSTRLAAGDVQGLVNVWHLPSPDAPARLEPRAGEIRAVAFHPAENSLAAACSDGNIVLWQMDGAGWRERERFQPHAMERPGVRTLAFTPDGQRLISGARDGTIAVRELAAQATTILPTKHDGPVSELAVAADGKRFVSAGFEGTLRLWDLPALTPAGPPLTGHVGRVLAVAFSPDSRLVASGGSDQKAILWDSLVHIAPIARFDALESDYRLAFSRDGAFAATGYRDGRLMLIAHEGTENCEVIELPPHPATVMSLYFSRDNQYVATGSAPGTVRLHRIGAPGKLAPELVAEFAAPASSKLTAVAVSPGAKWLAAAVMGGKVFVWDVATRALLPGAPFQQRDDDAEGGGDDSIFTLDFSPDGSLLASGGDGERAVIWNVARVTPVVCAEEHTGSIRSVTFSPDGRTLATASGDNTLLLWDSATGKPKGPPLTGHRAPVISVAFSPDGKMLATGSDDRSVIVWDVETQQRSGRLQRHTVAVRALAFRPNGCEILSGSWDHETFAWQLDPETLRRECAMRANRNLSPDEWRTIIGEASYRKTWPSLPGPGEGPCAAPAKNK